MMYLSLQQELTLVMDGAGGAAMKRVTEAALSTSSGEGSGRGGGMPMKDMTREVYDLSAVPGRALVYERKHGQPRETARWERE